MKRGCGHEHHDASTVIASAGSRAARSVGELLPGDVAVVLHLRLVDVDADHVEMQIESTVVGEGPPPWAIGPEKVAQALRTIAAGIEEETGGLAGAPRFGAMGGLS